MADRLVLATRNAGKVRELRGLLSGAPELAGVEVVGVGDLGGVPEVAETGVTFISVGRLTQSAPAADIGLDFTV